MIFLKKYISALAAILLFAFYMVIAWTMHRSGYEHTEAMFMAEKAKLLFQARDNTLMILGVSFPTLAYLSTVVFSFFGFPFAPVLASITFIVILFYVLINDFSKTEISQYFYLPILSILFIFHPGLLYAAVSGRSIALVLLFFYLVFRNLFVYYKTQTTFSLSIASIFLTALIFCNYNFIWMLLALIPLVIFISIEGLKQANHGSAIVKYYEGVNNRSQRRKLANRTIAIYIILFALPLTTVYLFKLLNQVHAGNANYFITSQYSNWSVSGTETLGSIFSANRHRTNIIAQTQIIFQAYLLILTPILILVFIMFKGKLYELLTIIAPFIFIGILLLENQVYLTIEYYLIFLVLGLIGLYYYAGKKQSLKKMQPIMFVVTLLNVLTGFYYFKKTSDIEEKQFVATLRNKTNKSDKRVSTETFKVAKYLDGLVGEKSSGTKEKILMDDAAAYPIIAQMDGISNVILPINHNFITVAENPRTDARYLCVAKKCNRLQTFTILNEYNMGRLSATQPVKPTIMFETDNWAIYRLNDVAGY